MRFKFQGFAFWVILVAGFHNFVIEATGFYFDHEDAAQVTFFLDTQFRGLRRQMEAISECSNLEGTWNNAASSVDVQNNACVKFFDAENCAGGSVRLSRRTDYGAGNLQLIGLNKRISSFVKC